MKISIKKQALSLKSPAEVLVEGGQVRTAKAGRPVLDWKRGQSLALAAKVKGDGVVAVEITSITGFDAPQKIIVPITVNGNRTKPLIFELAPPAKAKAKAK